MKENYKCMVLIHWVEPHYLLQDVDLPAGAVG
jgi:hypothetical protein